MRQKLPDQKKSGIYFRIAHMQNGYDAYHAPNSIKSFLTAPHPLRHCSRPKPFRTVLCSGYMNKGKKKSLFTRYVKDSGQRAAFSNSSNNLLLTVLNKHKELISFVYKHRNTPRNAEIEGGFLDKKELYFTKIESKSSFSSAFL